MAINRFSQGPIAANIQSNFIPLPVDAIGRQIERKQSQYDTTKAYLNSMQDEILKTRALSPDTETLKGIQSAYEEKIAQGIEGLGGDYSRAGGIAEQIAKDLRKDYSQGYLGQINANYLKAQEHAAKLDKLRESGIIGDRGYNLGLKSISDFQGTKEVAPGKYNSMDLYVPTKEISIPEVSQKYSKASSDQYLATGQKYLNANTVAKNTFNNLIKDESVLSNAREEIRYKYGNLPKEKEDKLTMDYLWGIASNSGKERAFLEQFQPTKTGTDENGEPITFGYDKTDVNPTKSGIVGKIKTIKDAINAPIIEMERTLASKRSGIGGISPGFDGESQVQDDKKLQDIRKIQDQKFKTTITGDPILYDRLNLMGIDPKNSSEKVLKQALDQIEELDNSSRNTQYNIVRSTKADRAFDARNNSEFIKDGPIVDINNKPLSQEERKDIITKMNTPIEKGGIKLVNGGAVYGEGQPWPTGTLKVGAGDKTIMILPNQPNSPEHTFDRLKYVFTPGSGGYTEYQNGRYKEVLQQVKNPVDPSKPAARRYKVDSSGNTIPTNEYYIFNEGDDKLLRPFIKVAPEIKKK